MRHTHQSSRLFIDGFFNGGAILTALFCLVLVLWVPAAANADTDEICDFSSVTSGGGFSQATMTPGGILLEAESNGAFLSSETAHVIARFEYAADYSLPVTFSVDYSVLGVLDGGQLNPASNADVEFYIQVNELMEGGGLGPEVDKVFGFDQFLSALTVNFNDTANLSLTVNLTYGTEYLVRVGLYTRAQGFNADSDFAGGGRGVEISCLQVDGPVDTDGDGIVDVWENSAIDLNGDGTTDLNLTDSNAGGMAPIDPAVPSDPLVPDIYVSMRYWDCSEGGCEAGDLRSWNPPAESISRVVDIFADHGINLHVVELLPVAVNGDYVASGDGYLCGKDCVQEIYDSDFSLSGESAETQYLKTLFFRFGVWADLHPEGLGGQAFGNTPSFVINKRAVTAPLESDIFARAKTFMHELGHKLGLGHGGRNEAEDAPDAANYKPNHFSIMNYMHSDGLDDATTVGQDYILNYSEFEQTLDETAMNETVPIGLGAFRFSYICPNGNRRPGRSDEATNWDCDSAQDLIVDVGYPLDINNDRRCVTGDDPDTGLEAEDEVETVPAASDWANYRITGGPDGYLDSIVSADQVNDMVGFEDSEMVIWAGPDGVVDSPVLNDDVIVATEIWDSLVGPPSPDRTCDTAADMTDTQGHVAQPKEVGEVQQDLLVTMNEWDLIKQNIPLPGNGGNDQLDYREATEAEIVNEVEKRSNADLELVGNAQLSTSFIEGTRLLINYEITNWGPQRAYGPALFIPMPEGLVVETCDAGAEGYCEVFETYVLMHGKHELALNEDLTMQLEFQVPCTVLLGETLALTSRVYSKSIDANAANDLLEQSIEVLPRLSDFAVLGNASVYIEDRVQVRTLEDQSPAAVGNGGTGIARVGVNALTGNLTANSAIDLRNYANIQGDAISENAIYTQPVATVSGSFQPFTALPDFPALDSGFVAGGGGMSTVFNAGTSQYLPPGNYGSITLNSQAQVSMSAGEYYFSYLTINSAANVDIDLAAGDVVLIVSDGLAIRATPTLSNTGGGDLIIVYLGSNGTLLDTPLTATVLAPQAPLQLATPGAFVGSFFAQEVTVRPDVIIQHVPYCPGEP